MTEQVMTAVTRRPMPGLSTLHAMLLTAMLGLMTWCAIRTLVAVCDVWSKDELKKTSARLELIENGIFFYTVFVFCRLSWTWR